MNLKTPFLAALAVLAPLAAALGMNFTGPTSCWAYYTYNYSFRYEGNLNGAAYVSYQWTYSDVPGQTHYAMVPVGGTAYHSHYWTALGNQAVQVRVRGYVWNAALLTWEPTTPLSGPYSYGVQVSQPDGKLPRIDDAKKAQFSSP